MGSFRKRGPNQEISCFGGITLRHPKDPVSETGPPPPPARETLALPFGSTNAVNRDW